MSDPGYGFVSLSPSVRRIPREAARWDRRVPDTLAGVLDIELTAEQPLHIGSGSKRADGREVVLCGARIRGVPGIPGSSFKGVLRARYEAITRSCAPTPIDRPCKVRSSTTDIKKAVLLRAALRAPVVDRSTSCSSTGDCPACALFGRMSLRSRVTVTDLMVSDATGFGIARIPERFGPNLHHIGRARIDSSETMFEVQSLHGRKFGGGRGPAAPTVVKAEVIPAGARLTGQLRLNNVTPSELGGLFTALGYEPRSRIKLGGGKGHGFGRVDCQVSWRLTGGEVAHGPTYWRQCFMASEDRWSGGESDLLRLHQGDR